LGLLFLIMCFTNIKYIGHIYYPRNWEFYNETNYILVQNKPTREINFNVVFQRFQNIKLYHYAKSCEMNLELCGPLIFFCFFFFCSKKRGKNKKKTELLSSPALYLLPSLQPSIQRLRIAKRKLIRKWHHWSERKQNLVKTVFLESVFFCDRYT